MCKKVFIVELKKGLDYIDLELLTREEASFESAVNSAISDWVDDCYKMIAIVRSVDIKTTGELIWLRQRSGDRNEKVVFEMGGWWLTAPAIEAYTAPWLYWPLSALSYRVENETGGIFAHFAVDNPVNFNMLLERLGSGDALNAYKAIACDVHVDGLTVSGNEAIIHVSSRMS